MNPLEVPSPETGDEKEVYAFFGLTAYEAQVLERGAIFLATALEVQAMTDRTPEDFDRVQDRISRRPLGPLLTLLKNHPVLSAHDQEVLAKAHKCRNRIIHHYWWERVDLTLTAKGRQELIAELSESLKLLGRASELLDRAAEQVLSNVGISPAAVGAIFDRIILDAVQRYDDA